MKKRSFLLSALAMAAASTAPWASASDYPAKPVTIVVGAAAAGPTDIMARLLAREMGLILNQNVIVENKAGANSLIATEFVSRAPADGYTLLLAYNAHIANTLLMKSAKYDPLKDFTPVGLAVNLPMAMITSPGSEFKKPQDVIAAAKARPEAISFASSGNGSAPHLAGELLQTRTSTKMIHVPFKGNSPALAELMAGRIDFMFYPMVGIKEYVTSNRVRLMAVTSAASLPDYPGVPTTGESGLAGFDQTSPWIGLFAPARTPPEVVAKLTEALRATLAKPEVKERMNTLGAVPAYRTPAEFDAFLRQDVDRWSRVISAAGIKAE